MSTLANQIAYPPDNFLYAIDLAAHQQPQQNFTSRSQWYKHPQAINWTHALVNFHEKRIKISIFINFKPIHLIQEEYEDLQLLAMQGIHHYWSRPVRIDDNTYKVEVHIMPRKTKALKIDLAINQKQHYMNSRNPMILGLHARLVYNRMQYASVYLDRQDFKLAAAHTFGHSILHAFGGFQLSWSHKGSSKLLFEQPSTTSPTYPINGPIDLMCCYDDTKHPISYIRRFKDTMASETDVLRLISVSELECINDQTTILN